MATRTIAFQVSEELYQKVKKYLVRYEQVYGRKLSQKEFIVTLIEQALEEAEDEFDAALADDETGQNGSEESEETARSEVLQEQGEMSE